MQDVGKICAVSKVANAHGVLLTAIGVVRPGQERMVGTHFRYTERKVLFVSCFYVFIENDVLSGGLFGEPTAVHTICKSFNCFGDIPPRAMLGWHRHIGFLNTTFDFLKESVDAGLALREPLVCICIFFVEIGNGVGVIFVAQPSPRVVNIASGAFPNVFLARGNGCVEFHIIRVERYMCITCSFSPRARVDRPRPLYW